MNVVVGHLLEMDLNRFRSNDTHYNKLWILTGQNIELMGVEWICG